MGKTCFWFGLGFRCPRNEWPPLPAPVSVLFLVHLMVSKSASEKQPHASESQLIFESLNQFVHVESTSFDFGVIIYIYILFGSTVLLPVAV